MEALAKPEDFSGVGDRSTVGGGSVMNNRHVHLVSQRQRIRHLNGAVRCLRCCGGALATNDLPVLRRLRRFVVRPRSSRFHVLFVGVGGLFVVLRLRLRGRHIRVQPRSFVS